MFDGICKTITKRHDVKSKMSKKIKILKNSFFVNAACSHSGPDDYFTVKFRIVREGNIYGDVQILIHSTIGRPKSVLPPVLFKSIVDPGLLNTFLGNNLRPPASKKKACCKYSMEFHFGVPTLWTQAGTS